MPISLDNTMPRLTINQRNIYQHYLWHKRNNINAPCYVPRNPITSLNNGDQSKMETYFKTLQSLEDLNLISIDRTAPNYTGWIIKDPKRLL